MTELGLAKRQFGHRARLALSPGEVRVIDDQAHAARTMWNCLHAWWQMTLAKLPAQASQAVLKTYFRAWVNCWEGRTDEPNFTRKAMCQRQTPAT